MANIPFKSITFPGLPNKYTVPEISNDLMTAGKAADAKATGDALALKADKSTTYTKTEVDQMIEDVEVETDTTLAVSGAPADAKKVGDEISDIKADLDDNVNDLKSAISDIDNIVYSTKTIDLTALSTIMFNIGPSNNKWVSNNNYATYLFAIPTGASYLRITPNATNGTVFALLKTDGHTVSTTPNYATGCARTYITENNVYALPEDAHYMWVTGTLSGTDYNPSSIMFDTKKIIPDVDETLSVSGEAAESKIVGEILTAITNASEINKGLTFTSNAAGTSAFAYVTIPANYIAKLTGNSFLSQIIVGGVTYPEGTPPWTRGTVEVSASSVDRVGRINIQKDASVSVDDIDTVFNMSYQLKESVDALVNGHNFEILMCSRLAVRDDLPINLYLQNILIGINAKQIQRFTLRTHSNNDVLQDLNIAVFDTNDSSNTQNGYLRVMPTNLTAYAEKEFRCTYVRTAAGSGLSKNVMFIGDSLTWNGPMLSKIMERFETDVMNITSVGTVHTSGNHNGYYHEGRSGWSAYNYVHNPSKEASYGTVVNAFYNPVSETFDYSYYVSTTGITADYIFICLGTNDIGRDDVGESIGAMIDSIHAYNPNIKIGVWMPPPHAHYPNNPFADFTNGQQIDKQIVVAFDSMTANNVYLVPALYVVDAEHDFPSVETQYDPYNATLTYQKNTDRLHPLDSGYYKLGDLLYTYIKYFGSIDEQ